MGAKPVNLSPQPSESPARTTTTAPPPSPATQPTPTDRVQPTAEDLTQFVYEQREAYLASQIHVSRRSCPRASDLFPCARYQALVIERWADLPVHDIETQARFDAGTQGHDLIRQHLSQWGIRSVAEEKQLEYPREGRPKILTGHIDGKIVWSRGRDPEDQFVVPWEGKTINQYSFGSIHDVSDFGRYWWARQYPYQLGAYCMFEGYSEAVFILTDLQGHYKFLPYQYADYADAMEKLRVICKQAVTAAAVGEAEKLPFHKDPTVCSRCKLYQAGICEPPIDFAKVSGGIILSQELFELLTEHATLTADVAEKVGEDAVKRIGALDRKIKDTFRGREVGKYIIAEPEGSAGDGFVVNVNSRKSTTYDVPAEIKKQYARRYEQTLTSWDRVTS